MSARMPDLSYLDTLSNKELHRKCLEHGLPNIPVTDSSRQVILRRLRSSISGVPLNKSKNASATTKNTTSRRETIHSSKVTPAPEKGSSNHATSTSQGRYNSNNNRRTIAAEPSSFYPLDKPSGRSTQTTTTVSDVGSQSEDDDFYPDNSQRFNASREDSRLRRSISLTKSGVLTTSYTREVEKPFIEQEDVPQSYTYQRPQVSPTHALPTYEPQIERSYRSENSRKPLTQTLLNSTSYSEDTGDYNAHHPMQQHPRNTYSGSAAPFNTVGPTIPSIRQRQTIGSTGFTPGRLLQPTFQANTLYPQLNEFYEQNDTNTSEPMDLDTDSETEAEIPQHVRRSPKSGIESPYLSTFSRQLNAQKQSSPLSRPQRRANIANENIDSPTQQFLVLFKSLDQQYHIKFYFFLTLAVVLITLIYVILTP